MKKINTHNLIVDFGKHKNERWTRIPFSYLKWLVNETEGDKKEIAEAELKRRGSTIIPTVIELSGHSIDRASQITNEWKEQGVHSWLKNLGNEALSTTKGKEKIKYRGYKLIFCYGNYYPTLKTIIKLRK